MTDAEFSLCVDKYIKMVYRIAFHYFGKREDAEDITQEVFTKLYSSKISRENEDELKAWLIRVTSNTCHNVFRNPFVRRRMELEDYELCVITNSQRACQHREVLLKLMNLSSEFIHLLEK